MRWVTKLIRAQEATWPVCRDLKTTGRDSQQSKNDHFIGCGLPVLEAAPDTADANVEAGDGWFFHLVEFRSGVAASHTAA